MVDAVGGMGSQEEPGSGASKGALSPFLRDYDSFLAENREKLANMDKMLSRALGAIWSRSHVKIRQFTGRTERGYPKP